MQTVKIISKKSIDEFHDELHECVLCGVELAKKTVYFDEDYIYCKRCLKEVLSTSKVEEIKITRYGQI